MPHDKSLYLWYDMTFSLSSREERLKGFDNGLWLRAQQREQG